MHVGEYHNETPLYNQFMLILKSNLMQEDYAASSLREIRGCITSDKEKQS
jgi:hypothetical protein